MKLLLTSISLTPVTRNVRLRSFSDALHPGVRSETRRNIPLRAVFNHPFAEFEIEYLNHDVNVSTNSMGAAEVEAPHESFATLSLTAAANGVFTFGLPKAGWCGFAALGAGSDDEYKGKELSQDAVVWVQAKEMK